MRPIEYQQPLDRKTRSAKGSSRSLKKAKKIKERKIITKKTKMEVKNKDQNGERRKMAKNGGGKKWAGKTKKVLPN